jgi:hypothetical protein
MARILFFVFILLLLNAIMVIVAYSQIKYGKEYLKQNRNIKYNNGIY